MKKEMLVPQNWIDNFDIPSTSCEYTEEQWEKVQEMKEDLKMFLFFRNASKVPVLKWYSLIS